MTMADLERMSGMPRHCIHRYIRNGLLPAPVKTGKTMAYYDATHLARLSAIREIKGDSRLPLAYLKRMLEARESAHGGRGKLEGAREEGTPARGREKGRKQQIKEAAFKVFLEKGYARARIRDITSEAGISTGTFYIYYKDKKEVFMEVIDELIRNTVQPAEEAIRRKGDILRLAEAFARHYIENYPYFSGIINQLRGMMAEEEPQARDKFISLHRQLAEPIARAIRVAIERGLIREVDPELLARALMGVVEFLAIYLSFEGKQTATRAVSFMRDLLMNGLRVPAHD